MVGDSSVEEAVEAMKLGAWGYVVKPVSLRQIALVVDRALERRNLATSMKYLQRQVVEKYRSENIIGNSIEMLNVLKLVDTASASDEAVMITGDSGTGKHLIGKTIHTAGARAGEHFRPAAGMPPGRRIRYSGVASAELPRVPCPPGCGAVSVHR